MPKYEVSKYLFSVLGAIGITALTYSIFKSYKHNILDSQNIPISIRQKINRKLFSKEKILQHISINVFSECLTKIVNYTLEELFLFSSIIKENFDKEGNFIGFDFHFRNRNLNSIKNDMLKKIDSVCNEIVLEASGCSIESFNYSVDKYLKEGKYFYIKYSLTLLNIIKKNFLKINSPNYTFPENLKNNYLKVISNIYYLTLNKLSIQIKDRLLYYKEKLSLIEFEEYLKNEFDKELRNTYLNNLVAQRKEVCDYFDIQEDCLISLSTLLKCYSLSLDYNDIGRIENRNYGVIVSQVIENIKKGIFVKEYFDNNTIQDNIHDGVANTVNIKRSSFYSQMKNKNQSNVSSVCNYNKRTNDLYSNSCSKASDNNINNVDDINKKNYNYTENYLSDNCSSIYTNDNDYKLKPLDEIRNLKTLITNTFSIYE